MFLNFPDIIPQNTGTKIINVWADGDGQRNIVYKELKSFQALNLFSSKIQSLQFDLSMERSSYRPY